jgi:hypothetical protein
MKLVSFYCDVGTEKYYTECSLIFKNNCKKLGIDHLVINESFGENWIDNVRAKPIFLLKMINELNEDFIWLDIDCNIKRKIDFTIDTDWMFDLRKCGTPHDYVHCIKNTENNKLFLQKWIKEIEDKKKGSHTAFINIYKELNHSLVPKNYFSLGSSNVNSKLKYFRNE